MEQIDRPSKGARSVHTRWAVTSAVGKAHII